MVLLWQGLRYALEDVEQYPWLPPTGCHSTPPPWCCQPEMSPDAQSPLGPNCPWWTCLERGWREGRWRGLATRVMPLHPGSGGWIFRCRSEGPSEGAEVLQALILCTWRGSSRSVCPRVCWAYSRSGTMVPRAAWAGLPQISPTQFSPGTGFMPPWGMRVQLLHSLPNTWCSPYEHS